MLCSQTITSPALGTILLLGFTFSVHGDIPAGPDAPSSERLAVKERECRRRLVVEAFEKFGRHDDRWDADTRRFLELWVEDSILVPAKLAEMRAAASAAIDAGCDDPMITYLYGMVLRVTEPPTVWLPYLEKADGGFSGSEYAAVYRFRAALFCYLGNDQLGREIRANELKRRSIDLLIQTLASDDYHPDEQRILFRLIAPCVDRLTAVSDLVPVVNALANLEDMNPWLRKMITGIIEIQLAWAERGCGWASDVTEEGWKGFHKHLENAYAALTEAWRINPDIPEAATELITVAMAGVTPPEETTRYWFDRAVSAEFDALNAYAKYRHSLLPRWGGSVGELYAFGCECLATNRFESMVPLELLHAVNTIATDLQGDPHVFRRPEVCEKLTMMIDGYLREPTMSDRRNWFLSLGAAVAWRNQSWEDASRYADQIDGSADTDAFSQVRVKPEEALGEIDARTSEWAEELAVAESFSSNREYQLAATTYRKLFQAAAEDRPAKAFFGGRLGETELLEQFCTGEWVRITPNASCRGWTECGGTWSIDREGWLTGNTREDGLLLLCNAELGKRFEVRGEVRFRKYRYNNTNAGIYIGRNAESVRYSFRFHQHKRLAGFYEDSNPLAVDEIMAARENTFHVQRWDNELSACLNGRPLQFGVRVEINDEEPDAAFGIGGDFWYTGAVIQFRNLQVRLLTQRPRKPEGMCSATVSLAPAAAVPTMPTSKFVRIVGCVGVGLASLLLLALAMQKRLRK